MDVPKQYWPYVAAVVVGLVGFILGPWSLLAWLLAAAIACGGVIAQSTRWGIVASSVLGLGCSSYLFSQKLDAGGGSSICDINERISCGVVNSSEASEIFGIPIALIGAGFYLGLALAALLARDARARLYATTFALAAVSVLYSLYLAAVAVSLGAVCVMCITMYVCNGLLLWAGAKGIGEDGESVQEALPSVPTSVSFITVSATLLFVLLIGMSTYSGSTAGKAPPIRTSAEAPPAAPAPVSNVARWFSYARVPVDLDGSEPVLGDPEAPYLVVEFADFGCPHCAQASAMLKPIVEADPSIQVRFRPFVLSGACNPALEPGQQGIEKCQAAFAAECANRQGRFWSYASRVFSHQRDLSDEALLRSAREEGLNEQQFVACMQDNSTRISIFNSGKAGARLGLRGTPSFYLKGLDGDRWVEVCVGPAEIQALVDHHKRGEPLPTPAQATCF